LEWPQGGISEEFQAVAQGLLNPNSEQRFKAHDIKQDPFFAKVNWQVVRDQQAPFVPKPLDEADTSYFDGKINFDDT
jgi:hypothetical protein